MAGAFNHNLTIMAKLITDRTTALQYWHNYIRGNDVTIINENDIVANCGKDYMRFLNDVTSLEVEDLPTETRYSFYGILHDTNGNLSTLPVIYSVSKNLQYEDS